MNSNEFKSIQIYPNEGPAAPRAPPQLGCQRKLYPHHEKALFASSSSYLTISGVIHKSINLQALECAQVPIPFPILHVRAHFGCEST